MLLHCSSLLHNLFYSVQSEALQAMTEMIHIDLLQPLQHFIAESFYKQTSDQAC